MPRPPDDDDDLFEELMAQVDEAFAALELGDGKLGDMIGDGVREALRATLGDLSTPKGGGEPAKPQVTVLDGGKDDGAPDDADETPRPELRVAEPTDVPAESSPQSRVRVVRVGNRPRVSIQETPLHLEGNLRVDPGEEAWQTLFRGADPRTYRLACDGGVLEVALDGQIADRIQPGQTMDVEARLIRVRAGSDTVMTGRYARVR
ncbi:MAG: hypothetical protein JRI25_01365 [Deltaproteobacteria bacterium]|nr:hypothetical protein [Deltaproteobacteria bacterium]MBW2253228.1 hypothetical protein [Deltaproteobacteria bacterium]